ncbi:MAG TPA: ribosome recycling factor [Peptococcaceae bacterium]|nr:ribosome recycling factor [Peptococcaceae bacterium]
MLKEILTDSEDRMKKSVEMLRKELATVRAGRANPAILDKIVVEYYGAATPLNQLANISAPEPRMLTIQPWDKSAISLIEKAIQKSDIGINPNNDGTLIRLAIPQLTEERRLELVKSTKKKGEDCRVSIRNVRRDAMEKIKAAEKAKTCSEDDAKKANEELQKQTDKHIKEIDKVLDLKEIEIMEV